MIESSFICYYSLFDGLENEQIERIMALMKHQTFEEGAEIVVEGGHNDKIHFILDGRVNVTKDGIPLMELEDGGIFGEMEVLEILPAEATIRAAVTTKIMTLSIDALGEIYDNDLKTYSFIMMNLARDIARRLRRLNVRVVKESPPTEWS